MKFIDCIKKLFAEFSGDGVKWMTVALAYDAIFNDTAAGDRHFECWIVLGARCYPRPTDGRN